MADLFRIDLSEMFAPGMSLGEIVVRGTVIFLGLVVLMRVIPKRQIGHSSVNDMLFVVVVGGLAVEGAGKQIKSTTDTLGLMATVLGWSFLLDWLIYRFPLVRRLLEEAPTCLVRDGRVQQANLRREMITEEELLSHLRREQVGDPGQVREATLESDGQVSVIPLDQGHGQNGRPRAAGQEKDELREFLAAAERLKAKLDWHEGQIDAMRQALAEHGVRPGQRGKAKAAGGG
jgi:uncharacterized membrane protein YcaP (DUF421 family)